MHVRDVLDSLIILVILACSISPSCKIDGVNNLIQVIHHLVGKFGGEEGDGGAIIEPIPCFVGQGFKFGNESIDFPWGEGKMVEFLLCALRGASILEGCFKGSGNSVSIVFICGHEASIILIKGPYGPTLDPIFDVFSLNEP